MEFKILGLSCIAALVLSLIMIPLMIRFSYWCGALDHPGTRKVHEKSMPTLGGLAFSISIILTIIIFSSFDRVVIGLLSGLIIILLTGVADDIFHIKPVLKFTGEITASLVFILITDHSLTTFGNLLGQGELISGWFAIPATVFCMVGVMNAWNFVDGLDGLAGGISLIACFFLAYFAYTCNLSGLMGILIILSGSLLGFLYFNYYPARIYMGDTGSLVLGYILSAICISLVQVEQCNQPIAPVSIAIIMGLPIVDALLVMTIRMIKGKNPFHPDNTHMHHRLIYITGKHKITVWVILFFMISCGLLAILLRSYAEWQQFVIGVIYATIMFGTLYTMHYIKVKKSLLDIQQL